jgi:hypothetical protein
MDSRYAELLATIRREGKISLGLADRIVAALEEFQAVFKAATEADAEDKTEA